MSHDYSENIFVQESTGKTFTGRTWMGNRIYAYNSEQLG